MKNALSARGGASHCAVLHVSRGPGTPPVPLWHRASHEVLGLDLSAWTPQRADLGPWCPSTCRLMALTFRAARSPSVSLPVTPPRRCQASSGSKGRGQPVVPPSTSFIRAQSAGPGLLGA